MKRVVMAVIAVAACEEPSADVDPPRCSASGPLDASLTMTDVQALGTRCGRARASGELTGRPHDLWSDFVVRGPDTPRRPAARPVATRGRVPEGRSAEALEPSL
jgi:hypothetical protein